MFSFSELLPVLSGLSLLIVTVVLRDWALFSNAAPKRKPVIIMVAIVSRTIVVITYPFFI